MAVFKYIAIDNKGMEVNGNVEAENIRIARCLLYKKKLCIIKIKLYSDNSILKFNKSVNKEGLVLITRQMATLVSASMPLDEVMDVIVKQNPNSKLTKVVCEVRKKIIEGYAFSDALSQFPAIFSPIYKSLITAGELSGHLGIALSQLADYIEQKQQLQRKVTQALIYPVILILMSIIVSITLLAFVVPNIIEQFVSSEEELPLSTRVLILISYTVKENLLAASITFFSFGVGINRAFRVSEVSYLWHRYYLKLPVLGRLSLALNMSRYLRTLSILISNGVPLVKSMNVSSALISNYYLKEKLLISTRLVSEGCSLSFSLERCRVLSPMIVHMITSGERSGKLNSMLERVSLIQEDELTVRINFFIALLEPVIILFMASFIFFIILAIIQPIIEINNLII
ncbi:type II secretion system F family protein [Yersinia aldovae]|uniref:General secretion pathway protein F n=2 Tax=Yersinia aldovae TaxID=29483 RepID=A0ABM9SV89_YERAL|nr:type II secretion system F family protein [Yersinia aldovae]CNK04679.1 general protein secretion protein [Yersinia aldovae]CNL22168.1 general protein secretion protein [Yersinia aldovae]